MQSLARSIEASEIERQQIAESLRELTQKLSLLADNRHGNAMLAENLANVEAALAAMAREMKSDRAELNATITMELRGLAKTLARRTDHRWLLPVATAPADLKVSSGPDLLTGWRRC